MENLNTEKIRIMSPTDWAITIFISSLPLIGFIMLLVWAFGNDGNINRQNYAKGSLIIFVIGLILFLFFLFVFGGIALISAALN